MNRTARCIIFLIIFNFFASKVTPGFKFDSPKTIKFYTESESPLKPRAFCVTEDEIFIIPDYDAGNIKLYERIGDSLELVKTLGRQGYGPGEFVKPTFCFYNKEESKFGVMDWGIKKIFIYDRIRRTDFELVKEINCLGMGTDIQLVKDKLLITGTEINPEDKTAYDLYYINIRDDQRKFLLSSYKKFGCGTVKDYNGKYLTDFMPIGIGDWFDALGDNIYMVWEGDLKIFKINLQSGKIKTTFGHRAPNYVKPQLNAEFRESFNNKESKKIQGLKDRMSYIRNIFASPKFVLVIYEGPIRQDRRQGESNFRGQFYTLAGEYKHEVPIPGQPDRFRMWLDKDKNILYSLSSQARDGKEEYFVLEYKITESKQSK